MHSETIFYDAVHNGWYLAANVSLSHDKWSGLAVVWAKWLRDEGACLATSGCLCVRVSVSLSVALGDEGFAVRVVKGYAGTVRIPVVRWR